MNLQQCLAAADEIEKKILIPRGAIVERSSSGRNLSHLRWMVAQMRDGMAEDKAMRWLGYIQGALVCNHCCTLDHMMDLSRRNSE